MTISQTQKTAGQSAREALKSISVQIKRLLPNRGINEVLEELYRKQSGQTEFDTFKGWKQRGYIVDKGARGYILWSKPHSRSKADEKAEESDDTNTEERTDAPKKSPKSLWVCYIFSAAQVHDKCGNRPPSYKPTLSQSVKALPIPPAFKADLATITHSEPIARPVIRESEFELCDEIEAANKALPTQFEFAF